MKISSLIPPSAAIALITAALFAVGTVAQAPQGPPPGGGGGGGRGGPRNFPAPTNLMVLPKDLTGAQVRDIMRTWEGALGVECEECHAADPVKKGPNGRPQLNYADDSKDEKKIARVMYTMTEDMKANYVSKAAALDPMADDAAPLTCGTCHRGKEYPDEFVPPKRNQGGGQQGGAGGPAAAAPAPTSN